MLSRFRILPGLPPYGPMATAFPSEWLGHEGTVVQFDGEAGAWVANFRPGLGGINLVAPHPNHGDVVVITSGDLWVVNPEQRSAERLLPDAFAALEVDDPTGWGFSPPGIA